MTFDCSGRNAKHVCGLLDREAAEVSKFHQPRLLFVHQGQCIQSIVKGDQFGAAFDCAVDIFIKGDLLKILSTLFSFVLACVFLQQPTHYLSGNSEKVSPILPVDPRLIHQSQVSFVYQCSRLQRVIGTLATQVISC